MKPGKTLTLAMMLVAGTLIAAATNAQNQASNGENEIVRSLADLAQRQAAARKEADKALADSKQKHADDLAALNASWSAGEIASPERERKFKLLGDERKATDEQIRLNLKEELDAIQEEANQIPAKESTAEPAATASEPKPETPCIIGVWVSNKESVTPKTDAAKDEVVGGGYEIEFSDDGRARISYDNYEVIRRMELPGISQVMRGVYTGTAEGRFQLKGPSHGMAVRFESKININVFRERAGSWQAIGPSMDRPIHSEGDYVIECSGNSLTLSSEFHSGFEGAYTGHLSRK
jgi:hypothetical protein